MTAAGRPSPLVRAGALVAVGVGAAVLFAFNPGGPSAWFWRCPFHLVTGLFCPGCGGQRAAHLLLHGDLFGAMAHNALLVLSLPLLAYVFGCWLVGRPHGLPRPSRRPVFYGALGVTVAAFFVLRNLDGFAWLAPPG